MSKKKPKSNPCNCADQINEKLAESGVCLSSSLSVNFKTGMGTIIRPLLKVEWIDKPKRGRSLPVVTGRFCPVCGADNTEAK